MVKLEYLATFSDFPNEMRDKFLRMLDQMSSSVEEQDYFHKDIDQLAPLKRFLKKHDLEHPQIQINEHPLSGHNQSERQSYILRIQAIALEAKGRAFRTSDGALQSFIPGNDPKTITKLTEVIAEIWHDLAQEQKGVVSLLSAKWHSTILALLLVIGESSPTDYAQCQLACEGEGAHSVPDFGETPTQDEQDFLDTTRWLNERGTDSVADLDEKNFSRYNEFLADANISAAYLHLCVNPILEVIRSGESTNVEFKSSFRWDLREKRINAKQIQGASLKTLAAFMNSGGGTLIIGVSDDHSILGIEHDQYKNRDQYERAIISAIRERIGSEFVNALRIEFHEIGHHDVVAIKCLSDLSPGHAFVDDEFFIRQGPMNVPLTGRRLVEYIAGE